MTTSGHTEAGKEIMLPLLDALVPQIFRCDAHLAQFLGVPPSTLLRWRRGTVATARHYYVLRRAAFDPSLHAQLAATAAAREKAFADYRASLAAIRARLDEWK